MNIMCAPASLQCLISEAKHGRSACKVTSSFNFKRTTVQWGWWRETCAFLGRSLAHYLPDMDSEQPKHWNLNAIRFLCAVHGFLNPGCRLSELERKEEKRTVPGLLLFHLQLHESY